MQSHFVFGESYLYQCTFFEYNSNFPSTTIVMASGSAFQLAGCVAPMAFHYVHDSLSSTPVAVTVSTDYECVSLHATGVVHDMELMLACACSLTASCTKSVVS